MTKVTFGSDPTALKPGIAPGKAASRFGRLLRLDSIELEADWREDSHGDR